MSTDNLSRVELIRSNPAHKPLGEQVSKAGVFEAAITSPSVDRANRLVSGMLTTGDVDSEGDIIMPEGVDLDSYYPGKVKAVYWNHDYRQLPVGTCRRLVRKGNGLWQQTYICPSAFCDELLTCIEAGCVAHMSIGFIPTETGDPTPEQLAMFPECNRVIRKCMALEGSLVAMPANAAAKLDELLSKGMVTRVSAIKMGLPVERVAAGVRRRAILDTKHWLLTNPNGQVSVL